MTDEALPSSQAQITRNADAFNFGEGEHRAQPGIGIALSGGGFRAMLFHAGALARLNEFGLLSKAKRISSVSGGSIISGYLAMMWNNLSKSVVDNTFDEFKDKVVEPILKFSHQNIDVVDALTGLLPWETASGQVAKSYDSALFKGATLQDIPDTPSFIFCATNLQTGVLWRFTKAYAGDYVIGYLDKPKTPLAQAVAASSAFPPILSPFTLTPDEPFKDWPDGAHVPSEDLSDYRKQVILTDGGVYDNHGIEPIVKSLLTDFVSDGGAPFQRTANLHTDWISQLKRILDVTDNQVRARRRSDLIDRFIAGKNLGSEDRLTSGGTARMGAYWGIDTDPSRVNPAGALPCDAKVTHKLAQLGTRLSDLGDTTSKQVINWGYVVADRSIRANYVGAVNATPPQLPYPGAPLV